MPEFSACYFCGTALDAPLAEYPVVPDALHPRADQQRTVVLCPSCRRKLGAVIDAVVDAVDDAPAADSVQQELDDPTPAGTIPTPGENEPSSGGPDVDEDDHGESSVTDDTDAIASETQSTDSGTAEDSGFEFPGDEQESAAVGTTVTEEGDASVDDAGTETAAESSDAATTDAAMESEDSAERRSRSGDAPSEEAPSEDASSEDDTSEDEPQMTALEYNKVMRLLQNREFPIDKEEFKVVATNAYEIDDDEFEAVIEAAAKRDLIGLEGGKIVEG